MENFRDPTILSENLSETTTMDGEIDFFFNTENEDSNLFNQTDEETSNSRTTSTPVPKNRKRSRRSEESEMTDDPISRTLLETLNSIGKKLKTVQDDEDEDSTFLKSIGFEMKKMTEQEKSEFKLKMLNEVAACIKKRNP